MEVASSKPGLKNLLKKKDSDIQGYFSDLIPLIENDFDLDIMLAYVFYRIEQGQLQTLFCGARKLHKTDKDLTWRALNIQHITRSKYIELFENIYGFKMDPTIQSLIQDAEKVRDRLMHGKGVSDAEKREAISKALHYADGLNDLICNRRGLKFKPYCPDLRGFTGALESQDKATSKWILKGIGFGLK